MIRSIIVASALALIGTVAAADPLTTRQNSNVNAAPPAGAQPAGVERQRGVEPGTQAADRENVVKQKGPSARIEGDVAGGATKK